MGAACGCRASVAWSERAKVGPGAIVGAGAAGADVGAAGPDAGPAAAGADAAKSGWGGRRPGAGPKRSRPAPVAYDDGVMGKFLNEPMSPDHVLNKCHDDLPRDLIDLAVDVCDDDRRMVDELIARFRVIRRLSKPESTHALDEKVQRWIMYMERLEAAVAAVAPLAAAEAASAAAAEAHAARDQLRIAREKRNRRSLVSSARGELDYQESFSQRCDSIPAKPRFLHDAMNQAADDEDENAFASLESVAKRYQRFKDIGLGFREGMDLKERCFRFESFLVKLDGRKMEVGGYRPGAGRKKKTKGAAAVDVPGGGAEAGRPPSSGLNAGAGGAAAGTGTRAASAGGTGVRRPGSAMASGEGRW